jgi:hypothetical protein
MNIHDLLTVLVLILTPLATVVAVRIQLRGEADRDLHHFRHQRLEARDATVRAAYAKILQAAELLYSATDEVIWYPKGRPYVQQIPVTSGAIATTAPHFISTPHDDGDFSHLLPLVDKAQQLESEAKIDIGMEHDRDTCLEFFHEHLYRAFWTIRNLAETDDEDPEVAKMLAQFSQDKDRLVTLARENRAAILEGTVQRHPWWSLSRS